MRGDFSRDTFDPAKRYRRVLLQQGRVMLDADFNEQSAILLHYLQSLAVDLIGWHAGPRIPATSFEITDVEPDTFKIGRGRYYVDGLLCENEPPPESADDPAWTMAYRSQPDLPLTTQDEQDDIGAAGDRVLIYLDAWERHVSHSEDAQSTASATDGVYPPGIREVALGGPDTASRSRVVWQVRTVKLDAGELDGANLTQQLEELGRDDFLGILKALPATGRLKARAFAGAEPDAGGPCAISPESSYRGGDNRLYRVEIHRPGTAVADQKGPVTFKWSRENGSTIFPLRAPLIRSGGRAYASVTNLGRDGNLSLTPGDWVEIVDDHLALHGEPGSIHRVESVDLEERRAALMPPGMLPEDRAQAAGDNLSRHPFLRRWDRRPNESRALDDSRDPDDNALFVTGGDTWITLEDSLQVQFMPGEYRSGDYWLIPARVATGAVEWPLNSTGDGPQEQPARGVRHAYAPLAIATIGPLPIAIQNCRRTINELWTIL